MTIRDSEIIAKYPDIFEDLKKKDKSWIITLYMRLYHLNKLLNKELHSSYDKINLRENKVKEKETFHTDLLCEVDNLKRSVNMLTAENSKMKRNNSK